MDISVGVFAHIPQNPHGDDAAHMIEISCESSYRSHQILFFLTCRIRYNTIHVPQPNRLPSPDKRLNRSTKYKEEG